MQLTRFAAVCACLNLGAAVCADTPAGGAPAARNDALPELTSYFSGRWQCSGHFANGKPISATESFGPILNGAWLLQVHDDDPPFAFHAYSLWGVDRQSGDLLVTIHDVAGGVRLFRSAAWRTASSAFVLEAVPIVGPLATGERFTYERKSAALFTFAYAIRRGSGDWTAVDHSECSKHSPADSR